MRESHFFYEAIRYSTLEPAVDLDLQDELSSSPASLPCLVGDWHGGFTSEQKP